MTRKECRDALEGARRTMQSLADRQREAAVTHREARTGYLAAIAAALLVIADCELERGEP
jgi:hypothetical protein